MKATNVSRNVNCLYIFVDFCAQNSLIAREILVRSTVNLMSSRDGYIYIKSIFNIIKRLFHT